VQVAILYDLHDVMYMSMNHNENIEAFKKCAKKKKKQFFINIHLMMHGQIILDLILAIWYVIISHCHGLSSTPKFSFWFWIVIGWPYLILVMCVVF